tara:strand:+ start:1150 stop:1740 length:591 start_codon:yes stop_codon:yes gene_type:complete
MKTLVLVDIQNDFLKGGSLAVPEGEKIIKPINKIIKQYDLVIATKDWHPKNHISFASNHSDKKIGDIINVNGVDQVLWPDHCIQNSYGSDFPEQLDISKLAKVVYKGSDANIDSYSGFFDNGHFRSTGLSDYLKSKDVYKIDYVGLATDYCLKYTAIDSVSEGFKTRVLINCIKGIEEKDCELALNEMKSKGVELI